MSENEFNMDTALEKLLSEERKKRPFYLISADRSQMAILDAFYEHLTALKGAHFSDIASVDDFLLASTALQPQEMPVQTGYEESEEEDDEEYLSNLSVDLDHLIQRDVETHDILIDGEVHVKGEGIYMFCDDVDEYHELKILEGGDTIMGDMQMYAVAPQVAYSAFLKTQHASTDIWDEYDDPDTVDNTPGLWVKIRNALVLNEAGMVVESHEEVIVPFTYPSLTFNKVVRRDEDVLLAPEKGQQESTEVHVIEHFRSHFIVEMCNDIENDLNHNAYGVEEERDTREQNQEQLEILMSPVDKERYIALTARTLKTLDGHVENDVTIDCRYLEPVLMKPGNEWRVVHTFSYTTNEGEIGTAHVLPEDIVSLTYKNKWGFTAS